MVGASLRLWGGLLALVAVLEPAPPPPGERAQPPRLPERPVARLPEDPPPRTVAHRTEEDLFAPLAGPSLTTSVGPLEVEPLLAPPAADDAAPGTAGLVYRVDQNPCARTLAQDGRGTLSDVEAIAGLGLDLTPTWKVGVSLEWSERDFTTVLVPDTDRYLRMDESWFLGLWSRQELGEGWDARIGIGWTGNDPKRPMRPEFGLAEEYREFVVTIGTTLRF